MRTGQSAGGAEQTHRHQPTSLSHQRRRSTDAGFNHTSVRRPPNMTLQGKIALVTGASRGIGQAIALELGKQGATVIGTATSDKGAQAISAYLDAAGIKGICLLYTSDAADDLLCVDLG